MSSLSPLVAGTDTIWIAAAMGEHDRAAAERGLMEIEGFRLQSLALDPDRYRMAYDVVSNATLWFLHHGLFDLARRPRLDRRWLDAWTAYQQVNTAFADAVVETAPEGATVLVQDYHLALVGAGLARRRPDLRAVHFTHTPFSDPSGIRILPSAVAEELLAGMAAHVSCGFHAPRWAQAFEACCAEVLGSLAPYLPVELLPAVPVSLSAVSVIAMTVKLSVNVSIGRSDPWPSLTKPLMIASVSWTERKTASSNCWH